MNSTRGTSDGVNVPLITWHAQPLATLVFVQVFVRPILSNNPCLLIQHMYSGPCSVSGYVSMQ